VGPADALTLELVAERGDPVENDRCFRYSRETNREKFPYPNESAVGGPDLRLLVTPRVHPSLPPDGCLSLESR
jgi:hypothetical protein